MLNIYYGRESIDKEKFIYEKIAEKQGRTLVIVPDQYTLEGEKQAFRLLHTESLLDVEIISMSRLGSRLLAEQGGNDKTFIDKYGRHMILSRIAGDCREELQVFGTTMEKQSFLEMTNNFISEMKQYEIMPTDLADLREGLQEGTLLYRKLWDLQLIYEKYEKAIEGKYTDAEDLITLYQTKIEESPLIAECDIWIYGFDSFAPKALSVLGKLMTAAKEFNIFLTYDKHCADEDLFRLPELVIENLKRQAEAHNIKWALCGVGRAYEGMKGTPAGIAIEKQLYAMPILPADDHRGLTIVEAANMYEEAEAAATHVLHLIRDKGLRYRDIVIICNDQKTRGSVLRRVFEEYNMEIFHDRKRSIMSSPIAILMVALIEAVVLGYTTADLLKVWKTGVLNISAEDIERLENYALQYRIKGSMWKKPFERGVDAYGGEGLDAINQIRQKAMDVFAGVEQLLKKTRTVKDFLNGYYTYLVEEIGLHHHVEALAEEQEAQGDLDLAEETRQIWGSMMMLLDQIAELEGDEIFQGKAFLQMLKAGLSQMEVGVLPPTADDLLMGTVQRTRSGEAKAIVVVGANEGLFPANPAEESLFSLDELDYLAMEHARELCKTDGIRRMEEQLAIYRTLSKATEDLWISYSASDEDGKETRPSEIIDTLLRIFPAIHVERWGSGEHMEPSLGGKVNTLRHMTKALQAGSKGASVDPRWKVVLDWYRQEEPVLMKKILHGLNFKNQEQNLPKELVELLYKRDESNPLTISPSRLERFSRCPFAHFISYGLKPEERRIFQASGREIGDLYHHCLMELSEKLTKEARWDTITEEECRAIVSDVTQREGQRYREGLFQYSNEEKYKLQRITETCFHVCWALIEQVRAGEVIESRYEEPFGKNHEIPPITVDCGEQTVLIEGIIDRCDTLQDQRVKIIDYKTGREIFDLKEARGGYRLQLMLYLRAAQGQKKKPAGVFYFLINEPRVDLTETEKEKIFEKISKEMKKSFRLNGIMVEDDAVIRGIAGEFDGFSDIVPLRNSKEGVKGTSENFLLSEEDFIHLQTEIDQQMQRICTQLLDGRIEAHPKKTEKTSPCVYCDFRSICRFDTAFEGCNYEVIS